MLHGINGPTFLMCQTCKRPMQNFPSHCQSSRCWKRLKMPCTHISIVLVLIPSTLITHQRINVCMIWIIYCASLYIGQVSNTSISKAQHTSYCILLASTFPMRYAVMFEANTRYVQLIEKVSRARNLVMSTHGALTYTNVCAVQTTRLARGP